MSTPAELSILYLDDHLVAIHKPAGLLVHRTVMDRHETRFAVQLLRDQLGQRVDPLHRLDKPTSGILLFALDAETASLGHALFDEGRVEKTYWALVRGWMEGEGLIDHALRPMDGAKDVEGKPSQTEYRCLERIEIQEAVDRFPTTRYSLVELQPKTGRRHQLRRHCRHRHHPIIGDTRHGVGNHN
ncbi:MAG: pseudouridine synthase, partial [Planctomycetota bacterium]